MTTQFSVKVKSIWNSTSSGSLTAGPLYKNMNVRRNKGMMITRTRVSKPVTRKQTIAKKCVVCDCEFRFTLSVLMVVVSL
jgi:hypothetical protein